MYRSPPKLRPRGKPETDRGDKKPDEPSLSSNSAPATGKTMPPTKADTSAIEACVSRLLTGDVMIDTLVAKLSDRLQVIVEQAVAAALKSAQEEIGKLTKELNTYKTKVCGLEREVECRVDDLEQYQRRVNLRVFGIPEAKGEDTDQLVVSLFNDKLKVNVPLSNIDRSHRVGKHQEPGPDGKVRHRPIIVRFTSYRDRRRVFDCKKMLKNSGVTVREDLTVCRLRVFQAAVDKHGIRNTWTVDGRIKWVTGEGNCRQIHSAVRLSEVL